MRGKRGRGILSLLLYTAAEIALIFLLVMMVLYKVNTAVNDNTYIKRFIARDAALLIDSIHAGEGDFLVRYLILTKKDISLDLSLESSKFVVSEVKERSEGETQKGASFLFGHSKYITVLPYKSLNDFKTNYYYKNWGTTGETPNARGVAITKKGREITMSENNTLVDIFYSLNLFDSPAFSPKLKTTATPGEPNTDEKKLNILFVGDSITAEEENYADILAQKLKDAGWQVQYQKAGFAGCGSAKIATCLSQGYEFPGCKDYCMREGAGKVNPYYTEDKDLIVIMSGVNDALNICAGNTDETKINLAKMYSFGKENNIKVIALTITPFRKWVEQHQTLYKTFSQEEKSAECNENAKELNQWILEKPHEIDQAIDVYTPLTGGSAGYLEGTTDGLHPSKESHEKIAEIIYADIQQ
jgi:lysophospholipase L1-like esterase